MITLAITVYVITGVILFSGKDIKSKLSLTEKLFIPAMIIFNLCVLAIATLGTIMIAIIEKLRTNK